MIATGHTRDTTAMSTAMSDLDERFDLTAADLHQLAHLLPPSAAELVRTVGADAAAALMRRLPGVQLQVPRHRAANPDRKSVV